MSSRPDLRLAWCSAKAARYACERWHYTRTLPAAGVKIGAWEDDRFIGVIAYGLGSGHSTRGDKYGFAKSHDIAELVRVALDGNRSTPVSRIVSISIRILKRHSPNLRMLISFADQTAQGHHGGIYQAMNWIYLGTSEYVAGFIVHGKATHRRSIGARGWKQSADWLRKHVDPNARPFSTVKHRYVYPLDDEARTWVEPLAKPYPKRASEVRPLTRPGSRGGATPTPTLQSEGAES